MLFRSLDLASGEIFDVRLSEDNDPPYDGFPGEDETYDFTCGVLSNGKKEVEFRIEVDVVGQKYSVTPSELLELKGRAAKLFSAAPDAPAPAPAAASAVDREMLEIFLEEANEVMATLDASIGAARRNPDDHDALLSIRRAFHTLKGSSRMVGLTAFGECAWEMEQTFNHWNSKGQPATTELLDLADDARSLLAEWAHALQGETDPGIDARGIASRASALRGEPAALSSTANTPVKPLAAVPRVEPAGTPEAEGEDASAETAVNLRSLSFDVPAPDTPPAPASSSQTLSDLGERLAWLKNLVEEIQQSASGTRAADTAATMGESMEEVLALYQRLSKELGASQP